jgi:predicted dithiol-disulfide oxidoreductase (DUF899 family)
MSQSSAVAVERERRRTEVGREAWLKARKALLAREKAFNRERDALSAARRALPMVRVDKRYVFDGPEGPRALAELFDGKRQLLVYHFMFAPEWEQGCKSCSYVVDNITGGLVHLAARDTAFAVISRAPLAKLQAFQERMGWSFRWLSSEKSDFNYDYRVSFTPAEMAAKDVEYNYGRTAFPHSEAPGLSVFLREGDGVFHTYSTYARGLDLLMNTYNYLDLTPLGRNETPGGGMAWLRHHDRYGEG